MDNFKGIIFMILAMSFFSLEDLFIKQASVYSGTGQILLTIGFCGALVFATICRFKNVALFQRILLHPAMILRVVAEGVGFTCLVIALSRIPLSLATAIVQATPLLIVAGAALIFKETVGWRRWLAISVGFIGVLIVLRPGLSGFDPDALYAVVATICFSSRDFATRPIPAKVSNHFLSFYGFAAIIPAAFVMMYLQSGPVMPATDGLLATAAAVVTGIAGYFAITVAIRTGEMSVVAPYRYLRLVFALLFGVVILGETLDFFVILGASMIVGSGIYTILREARLQRLAASQNTPLR